MARSGGQVTLFPFFRALFSGLGSRHLKIAAVALTNDLTVLSRNRRDFGQVPGLKVDDWSV